MGWYFNIGAVLPILTDWLSDNWNVLILGAVVVVCTFVEMKLSWWEGGRHSEYGMCMDYTMLFLLMNLLSFLVVWIWHRDSITLALWYFLCLSILFVLAFYDLNVRLLPDRFILLFAGEALLWHISSCAPVTLLDGLLGAAVLALVSGVVWLINRDAIGLGDIKLLAALGFYAGLSVAVHIVVRGVFAAFFVALLLLVLKKAGRKTELPFVPFLLIGAVSLVF